DALAFGVVGVLDRRGAGQGQGGETVLGVGAVGDRLAGGGFRDEVAACVVFVFGDEAGDRVAAFGEALAGLVAVVQVADDGAAATGLFAGAVADRIQRVGGGGDEAGGVLHLHFDQAVVAVVGVVGELFTAGIDSDLARAVATGVVAVVEAGDFAAALAMSDALNAAGGVVGVVATRAVGMGDPFETAGRRVAEFGAALGRGQAHGAVQAVRLGARGAGRVA